MIEDIKEFQDKGTPDASIILAVYGQEVHVAYSKGLTHDDMLDILETAAIMIVHASEPVEKNSIVH